MEKEFSFFIWSENKQNNVWYIIKDWLKSIKLSSHLFNMVNELVRLNKSRCTASLSPAISGEFLIDDIDVYFFLPLLLSLYSGWKRFEGNLTKPLFTKD